MQMSPLIICLNKVVPIMTVVKKDSIHVLKLFTVCNGFPVDCLNPLKWDAVFIVKV